MGITHSHFLKEIIIIMNYMLLQYSFESWFLCFLLFFHFYADNWIFLYESFYVCRYVLPGGKHFGTLNGLFCCVSVSIGEVLSIQCVFPAFHWGCNGVIVQERGKTWSDNVRSSGGVNRWKCGKQQSGSIIQAWINSHKILITAL